MNKRVKSTAILMALILAFSVFTSLAATTAAAAAATTPAAEVCQLYPARASYFGF